MNDCMEHQCISYCFYRRMWVCAMTSALVSRLQASAEGHRGGPSSVGRLVLHPCQPEHLRPVRQLLTERPVWRSAPCFGHTVPGQVWVAVCACRPVYRQGPGEGHHPQLQQVRVWTRLSYSCLSQWKKWKLNEGFNIVISLICSA